MTHFIVLILVPSVIWNYGPSEVRVYIAKQMAPYDENEATVIEVVHEKEELVATLEKLHYTELSDFLEDFGLFLDEKGRACHYHNPQGIYDWYSIGGRFKGVLTGPDCSLPAAELLVQARSVEEPTVFHHVVDCQGQLHQSRRVGWFACAETLVEEEVWGKTYERLLEEAEEGAVGVVLDCHI